MPQRGCDGPRVLTALAREVTPRGPLGVWRGRGAVGEQKIAELAGGGDGGAGSRFSISVTMRFDPYIAVGIAGAGCFVVAYFATTQGWLSAAEWRFPAINLLGAVLVLVSLADAWNLPSVVLECFWGAIRLYGLVRCWRRKRPPVNNV